MSVLYMFPEYKIGYEEHGEYQTYIGVIDMGEFFDFRVCMAKDIDTAAVRMQALGGQLCKVVAIAECMEAAKKALADPNYMQKINPVLISNKPSPIV